MKRLLFIYFRLVDFLKVFSDNSFLACWFPRWFRCPLVPFLRFPPLTQRLSCLIGVDVVYAKTRKMADKSGRDTTVVFLGFYILNTLATISGFVR